MLKQILATTTVIAIAVVSIQSASAASNKLRQLVVEPTGASADSILKKRKKFQQLVVQPGSGIATPDADAGKTGGKRVQFVVAPGSGIATPADTGNVGGKGNGNGKGKQVAEFVVAPGDGIPTAGSGGGAGNGKSGGKKFVPLILKPSNGITLASADPGKLPKTKVVVPAIADLSGISKPVGDDSTGPGADATPALDPALEPQPTDATDPAGDGVDNDGAAAPEATPAIESPQDLYSVLLTHGYGVQILKHDAHTLVFYVTASANPREADLLLVDAEHGKVTERKHILAYGYERPQTYAPRYASAYASDDNCDQAAGY